MDKTVLPNRLSIPRLILIPALISLAVTLLRLVGELRHWSPAWFSSATGGVLPSGVSWLIGITWLAVPFGIYFALRLATAGQGPPGAGRALGYALLGLAIILGSFFFLFRRLPIPFPQILIVIWSIMVVAALLQWPAWPALFKTLLAYGLAARIPVVVVMLLAMRGNWGTHYDYVGMPAPFQMSLWPKYLWLGFFPQLIFWVGFTILVGSLAGSLTVVILRRRRPSRSG